MDFVDGVLVRLADPGTRAAVFDDASLAHLVEAAYDTEAMPVTPPYAAVFDELTLGFVAAPGTGRGADAVAGAPGAGRYGRPCLPASVIDSPPHQHPRAALCRLGVHPRPLGVVEVGVGATGRCPGQVSVWPAGCSARTGRRCGGRTSP
ncbi:hypothetical protein [Micromonospora sp. CV4]|uniref:hypothetical protein n=1 Tax=Micromonospora sp. CV4 TaxID=2478711 RepID=UPI0011C34F38|nr:hypothetical protein [Micromonospora sp. CV4]